MLENTEYVAITTDIELRHAAEEQLFVKKGIMSIIDNASNTIHWVALLTMFFCPHNKCSCSKNNLLRVKNNSTLI